MDERPDNITAPKKNYYTIGDHGIVTLYLVNMPSVCEEVASEFGWQPEDADVTSWFNNLIFTYYLADQGGGKKSGSKDARIYLKTSFNTIDTLPKLVDKLQDVVRQRLTPATVALRGSTP